MADMIKDQGEQEKKAMLAKAKSEADAERESVSADTARTYSEIAKRVGHTIHALKVGQPLNMADLETMKEAQQRLQWIGDCGPEGAAEESRRFGSGARLTESGKCKNAKAQAAALLRRNEPSPLTESEDQMPTTDHLPHLINAYGALAKKDALSEDEENLMDHIHSVVKPGVTKDAESTMDHVPHLIKAYAALAKKDTLSEDDEKTMNQVHKMIDPLMEDEEETPPPATKRRKEESTKAASESLRREVAGLVEASLRDRSRAIPDAKAQAAVLLRRPGAYEGPFGEAARQRDAARHERLTESRLTESRQTVNSEDAKAQAARLLAGTQQYEGRQYEGPRGLSRSNGKSFAAGS